MDDAERLCAIVPAGSDATSLMIEPDEDGEGVYLFRYTDAKEVGDTWHESVAQALSQAEYEYEIAQDVWTQIPGEIDDPIAFCRARARATER